MKLVLYNGSCVTVMALALLCCQNTVCSNYHKADCCMRQAIWCMFLTEDNEAPLAIDHQLGDKVRLCSVICPCMTEHAHALKP